MKKFLSKYVWLWEFIGAALLTSLGIIVGFLNNILLVIVGVIFIFLGMFRFIPLLKTTDDSLLKWILAIELIVDIAAGIVLLIIGLKNENIDNLQLVFGYIICAILYLRGFVYLFSVSLRKEKAKIVLFVFHIMLLTVASILVGRGGFSLNELSWVILGLCVLCSLVICVDGVKKYGNYRNEEYAKTLTQKVKEEEKSSKDAPSADEIIEQSNITEGENPQDGLNA